MKVLLICLDQYRTDQTGAATQARETTMSLRAKGYDVVRVYVNPTTLQFSNDDSSLLSEVDFKRLYESSDVIHLLPCFKKLVRHLRGFSHKPTVASTIFWSGWERVYIALQNTEGIYAKYRQARSAIVQMIPWRNDYRGIDVFLPNSQAEGFRVFKSYRHDDFAKFVSIPNGFRLPSFDIEKLHKPEVIPFEKYAVVPGIFAPRKNQLGLIRACKGNGVNLVFLGGRIKSATRYYERCREEATSQMLFIDYLPSSSSDYWSILRHAQCACLASDCETPGIALIEAAYAGARPIVTKFGGTQEYYGFDGVYFDPRCDNEIQFAVKAGLRRGRLAKVQSDYYARYSWDYCADCTRQAYDLAKDICSKI